MPLKSIPDSICTKPSLITDLRNLGLKQGDTILLHSSLSSLGWVNGGAETVVSALLEVLGDSGTLVVPAHTGHNSDPAGWKSPSAPRHLWQLIRDTMPAYDPRTSRTSEMGAIAETVRTWPGAVRSAHPQMSLAALGPTAEKITAGHAMDCRHGEDSPLARLEEVGARVLFLGTGFFTCTCFHLAEHRSRTTRVEDSSFAAVVNGSREWVTVSDLRYTAEDFGAIGEEFDESGSVTRGVVGSADCRLFPIAEAVSFATTWMKSHRDNGSQSLDR
ncbi:hypothetical protein CSOJ01_12114 [Colletotrichum sojae]|uniref:Aminoglycoside N(3)-acetyltransferase n=1 Tax=Colletotrichum sojae TaxID=2175907 RepID=A0A8H6IWH8_9PEZI|nr:hypothetical protein CSOJ01_12114 [Colletotrichum sojae]